MAFAVVLGVIALACFAAYAAMYLLRGAESASTGFADEDPATDEMFKPMR